jgi:hypothetical protein
LSGFEAFLQKIQKNKETRKRKEEEKEKCKLGLGEPFGPAWRSSPQPTRD